MIATVTVPDPTAARVLTHLKFDEFGRVRAGLRRRRRRFLAGARLRKLFA
jgi:hypothetical protein